MYTEMHIRYQALCDIFMNIMPLLEVHYHPSDYGKNVFSIEYIEIDDMQPFKEKRALCYIMIKYFLPGKGKYFLKISSELWDNFNFKISLQ